MYTVSSSVFFVALQIGANFAFLSLYTSRSRIHATLGWKGESRERPTFSGLSSPMKTIVFKKVKQAGARFELPPLV